MAANVEMLSAGQLSPPFQFPQPVGADGLLSLGIDVGMIGGKTLGETVLESTWAVVVTALELEVLVVESFDVVDIDVELAACEVAVAADPI